MSSDYRPYQGYPYGNPLVTDAPSIDAATASRYDHLPRRLVNPSIPPTPNPGISGNVVTSTASPIQHQPRRQKEEHQREIQDLATVYIDLPEDADTNTGARREDGHNNPAFVQDTIFYDPFEDRRINSPINSDGQPSGSQEGPSRERLRLTMPSSSGEISNRTPLPNLPPFLQKQTDTYSPRPSPDDGFSLTPLPVPEYPDPPPAYSEIDRRREPPAPELPRTQAVIPDIQANSNRKFIVCPYCGQRVLTLMIRESGVFTHVMGILCLFAFFPIAFCIYCTNCCKYKNHYCPLCNNHIAYEVPALCQKMVYSKPH